MSDMTGEEYDLAIEFRNLTEEFEDAIQYVGDYFRWKFEYDNTLDRAHRVLDSL
jgi:hypothetical protein